MLTQLSRVNEAIRILETVFNGVSFEIGVFGHTKEHTDDLQEALELVLSSGYTTVRAGKNEIDIFGYDDD